VTRNAFLAADGGPVSRNQKPMRRYEHRPTSSKNMNAISRLFAKTNPSMLAVKRPRPA
jgi:hypothetical protein